MSWWLDISDLDDDQRQVIGLPPEGNFLILGPPGSGKTNLLLIRAEYLIRSGRPNVVVLMFNDPLHDFVVRGGANYDVPPGKIRKIMSWEITLLRENDFPFSDVMDDDDQDLTQKRKALANRVLELLDSNKNLEGHIQCVLVDELQDCLQEEIDVFFRCAENVCFAGDDKQRIFSERDVIKAVKERADVSTIQLTTHYRIGHQICTAADAVGKAAGFEPIGDTCNYKGPKSSVRFFPCKDQDAQANQMIEALKAQLVAYPDELLGVAAPRILDREFLRERLEQSEVGESVLPARKSGTDEPGRRIYIANLMEIKGLEFRTLHLGMMQNLRKLGSNQKRIAFTAITRAKTSLSVYYTGKITSTLEVAEAAVEPPKATPELAALFPRKSKAKK